MINVRTIKKLKENDGLTLRNGKPITYRTGWQVATEGIETTNPDVAKKRLRHTAVIADYGIQAAFIILIKASA